MIYHVCYPEWGTNESAKGTDGEDVCGLEILFLFNVSL